jgi:hypothetical protein
MTPKKLRDFRCDLPEFEWDEDYSLNEPRIRIENVNYNAPTLTALIEVRFRENKGAAAFEHSRSFSYQLDEESAESISAENVQQFIEAVFTDAVEVK